MTADARVSRAVADDRERALDTAVAAETAMKQERDAAESLLANARPAGRLRVRPARRQDRLRLVPRRQVHLIRALSDYGTQERVGFSLDVDHPLRLGQALLQVRVSLTKLGIFDSLRIRLAASLGFERRAGGALFTPSGEMR